MDLLIVGASTRAAAFSALRCGLRPTCIDLFADADLASTCPTHRVELSQYPEGLATIAADLPPMPWLYTGAIENRPDLVDQISTTRPRLGNNSATLRAVRDPIALASAIRDAGLVAPEIRLDPESLPVDGSWLCKPLASGGGHGIGPWLGRRPERRGSSYYQQRIDGLSLSALYVGDSGQARCLGMTRQFVGKPGNRFAYRGSLAPWSVADEVHDKVERLGEAIVNRFGLVGLFGVDLILKDGQPWPIEVNPRYTASVEVVEWALGRSLLAEHFKVFGQPIEGQTPWQSPETFAAKAIVFADRACRWPWDWSNRSIDPAAFPEIADVPPLGTTFRPGEPVLIVFARGDTPVECRRALARQISAWRRRINSGE